MGSCKAPTGEGALQQAVYRPRHVRMPVRVWCRWVTTPRQATAQRRSLCVVLHGRSRKHQACSLSLLSSGTEMSRKTWALPCLLQRSTGGFSSGHACLHSRSGPVCRAQPLSQCNSVMGCQTAAGHLLPGLRLRGLPAISHMVPSPSHCVASCAPCSPGTAGLVHNAHSPAGAPVGGECRSSASPVHRAAAVWLS